MSGSVAVIVTCRDSGRAVAEAVASVRAQSRRVAEVVVVDAGSTDLLTLQVLEGLERDGARLLRTEGRAGTARNLGVSSSTGSYLLVLSADDRLDAALVEKAAGILDRDEKLDVVACGARWDADPRAAWAPPPCSVAATIAQAAIPAARMFRRAVWEGVGGFHEGHDLPVDADFFASAFARGMRGVVLPEPLLLVGRGAGSEHSRALRRDRHRQLMAALHARRKEMVEAHTIEVLVAKEELVAAQRQRHAELEDRRRTAAAELERLHAEVAALSTELGKRGEDPLDAGDLRRTTPLVARETRERAGSVERLYEDAFYARHRDDVRGRVLEAFSSRHTDAATAAAAAAGADGGSAITRREVLAGADVTEGTLVAELDAADGIPAGSFDALLLPGALAAASHLRAAVEHAERILAPGGILLATLPAQPELDPHPGQAPRWRPTETALRELMAEAFPAGAFEVESWGNVWAATAIGHGLPAAVLTPAERGARDPDHPVGFGLRAVKPASAPVVKRDTTVGAILLFRRVAPADADPRGIAITPGSFRSMMEYLSEHYRPLPLDDLIAAKDKGDIPPRSIAVTFDDGYADALAAASPILMALGIPATFYVGTESLDGKHEAWWDVLDRILLGTEPVPERLELAAAGAAIAHPTATPEERRAARDALQARLATMPAEERREAIEAIAGWSKLSLAPREAQRLLTGSEIAELVRRGFTVGGQTSHHVHLPSQPAAVVRREIEADRAAIEKWTGAAPATFCYPRGAFDHRVVAAVRDAGYEAAVTEREGMVWPATSSFVLPRIEVKVKNRGLFVEMLRAIHE